MLIAAIVLCCLMAPLIVLTLYFDKADNTKVKTFFKGLCSLCFVIAGALTFATKAATTERILVLVALICGFGGDVLLAYKAKSDKVQMGLDAGGMLIFIAGHALFMVAYFSLVDTFKLALLALILILPALVICLFACKVLTTDKPVMQVGALLYSLIIATTLASAINLNIYLPCKYSDMVMAGMVLFAASDLVLAFLNYCPKLNRRIIFPFVLVFYYTGQALIATSLCF